MRNSHFSARVFMLFSSLLPLFGFGFWVRAWDGAGRTSAFGRYHLVRTRYVPSSEAWAGSSCVTIFNTGRSGELWHVVARFLKRQEIEELRRKSPLREEWSGPCEF